MAQPCVAEQPTHTPLRQIGVGLVQALSAGTTVTDIFTYALFDGEGGTAYTTLTLTISGQNDAPLAQADSHALNAGDNAAGGDLTPGTIGQDSDTDGDPLTVVSFTNADGASGVVNGGLLDGHYGSLQVAAGEPRPIASAADCRAG